MSGSSRAMASLADFQAAFFAALRAEPDAVADAPFARQPGFAVYRNTVMAGCIEALEANYPTLRAVFGDERFRASAQVFARAHPPVDGVLAAYGASLPTALAAWLDDDDAKALAVAVATLDRAWTESHLAADAPPLDPGAFAGLEPAQFAAARLVPHPAARWRMFAEAVPAFERWRALREGRPEPAERTGEAASAALLTRPDGAVVWTAIDGAAVPFLDACADRRVVADALEAAVAAAPDADVGRWLPPLMHARAFTRIEAA